jgi:hypothetical protein
MPTIHYRNKPIRVKQVEEKLFYGGGHYYLQWTLPRTKVVRLTEQQAFLWCVREHLNDSTIKRGLLKLIKRTAIPAPTSSADALTHEVPAGFSVLAEKIGVTAEDLGRMLCEDIVNEDPNGLLIIADIPDECLDNR